MPPKQDDCQIVRPPRQRGRVAVMRTMFLSLLLLLIPTTMLHAQGQGADVPVSVRVDASRKLGKLRPIWRFFGADEPNYATMKDGKTLLGQLGEMSPKNVYFRTHNLLCTGDGTAALKWGSTNAYTEDAN